MALIQCPICGRLKSDETDICIHCGSYKDGERWHSSYGERWQSSAVRRQLPIGKIVRFGSYPQTSDRTSKTDIEWLLLDYDMPNNKVLLLSKYGLETKIYNKGNEFCSWETCTLRAWLNSAFLNEAFDTMEKFSILTTTVDNRVCQVYNGRIIDRNENTQDKIFLLSCADAKKYLCVERHFRNIVSRTAPTEYTIKTGVRPDSQYRTVDGEAPARWWLRSSGTKVDSAAIVLCDGSLDYSYVYDSNVCIRPAIWVNARYVL